MGGVAKREIDIVETKEGKGNKKWKRGGGEVAARCNCTGFTSRCVRVSGGGATSERDVLTVLILLGVSFQREL